VEALRRLDGLLADLDAPAPVVVVVDGMGGVGKTALAARWGHQVVGRFPDGQLYLDLRGHAATGPLRPWEAARRLLVALGDDPEEVPTSTDDAAARLRSMLAGRRVLLVLDDAVSVDQVRPLLPGTGGCLVLVTSRQRLTGLVVREGARQLPLDPLSETESVALLASLVGSGRVAAEPAAVAELARLCGHLPLPLRVVGAGLAGAPSQRLQDWVDLLRSGDRLRLLDVPGDRDASVEAALEASYLRLPVDAARMLRLVGLVPVESVAAPAAAALAGVALPRASHLLGNLVEARLLEEQAGRYTCRALVRAYAEQRGQHDEPPAGRAEALSRFYDFYCGTAEVVAALFYPAEQRPPATSLTAVASTAGAIRFTAPAQALGWIEDELGAVTSIVRHTAAHGPYQVAWRLADAIRGFLHHGARLAEADAIGRAAVEAAGAMGDPAARGAALVNLAGVRFQQGRYREAEAYGTRALRLLRGSGWDTREALARSLLGMASSDQGRVEEAVRHFLAALSRYERIGWPYGQAQAVGNLAVCVFELGRLREAADYAGRAAAVFADLGSAVNEAHGLANLGRTCYHLGQLEEAERHLTRAGQRYREAGDDAEQADPIAAMALVDSAAGRLAAARESAEAALVIVGRAGNARHEPDCWMALGTVHERSGDRGRAWSCFQRAMTAASATGERYAQAAALIGLAGACPPSETGAARAHLDAALAIIRRVGYRLLEGAALTGLAEVDLAEGAAAAAVARAQRALAVHRATGYRLGEADTHSLLYRALTATGRPIAAREHQRRADDLVVGWRVRSGDARTGTGTATAPTPVAS
jgi:tetratricopeptide (TPR) repeat protein